MILASYPNFNHFSQYFKYEIRTVRINKIKRKQNYLSIISLKKNILSLNANGSSVLVQH